MKTYIKIETLFKFNQETKRFNYNDFYNKDVENLKDYTWEFTEKVDGTNLRLYWDGYNLSYAGRTDKAIFSKPQKEYIETVLVNEDIELILEQMFKETEVYIFGELYGDNIQKAGKLYSDKYQFKVFDIEVNDVILERENMIDVSNKLNFETVPLLIKTTIQDGIDYVMNTDNSTFSDAPLEGIVGRPVGNLRNRLGNRIMVKIKKRDILKSDKLVH